MSSLLEQINIVRSRLQARELDLRDVGQLLTGKWDQDFIAELLSIAEKSEMARLGKKSKGQR